MLWNDLVGHQRQVEWFRNAIAKGRLGSAFLLVGPSGIGKRTFARLVATTLLCTQRAAEQFSPCGKCESCVQVAASTHPDLIELNKPSDKSNIPLELIIGPPDARMREGLIHDISLKSFAGRRKIAILDDADVLAPEGANSLLKTLEEPPPGAVIFLISSSIQRQLPTIRSRCQLVRFQALSLDEVELLATRLGWVNEPDLAELLARESQGSLTEFQSLLDPSLTQFRQALYERLAARPMDFVGLAKAIVSSLDAVGKEGAERRDRLKLILGFATQFYRFAMYRRALHDDPTSETDPFVPSELAAAVHRASFHWPEGETVPIQAIQRCMRAHAEVDRNLTAATILEAWTADLARICSA